MATYEGLSSFHPAGKKESPQRWLSLRTNSRQEIFVDNELTFVMNELHSNSLLTLTHFLKLTTNKFLLRTQVMFQHKQTPQVDGTIAVRPLKWDGEYSGQGCIQVRPYTHVQDRGRVVLKLIFIPLWVCLYRCKHPEEKTPYFSSSHRHYLPTKPRGNHFS